MPSALNHHGHRRAATTTRDELSALEGFPEPTGLPRAANRAQLSVGDRIEHLDVIELDPPDAVVVLPHWPRQAAAADRLELDSKAIGGR